MPTNKLGNNNLVGTTLNGRYYLEAEIGAGGFATVYRARDTQFKVKQVAVKVLSPEHTRHEEDRVRFRNEAMISAQIEDENEHIVRVTDYGECGGLCYYVMEYLHGTSLRQRIERLRGAPLPWPQALQIAEQLCEALEVAHRRGVVHRDLKPENVFLVRRKGSEHVKLLDLGIAKVMAGDTIPGMHQVKSVLGNIIGSAHYMSPEQVQGRACDRRADIYSLGVVMYEMLTGRVPYASDSEYEVMEGHVKRPPPRFATLAPTACVPTAVEAIVRRAMAKELEARFEDVCEMRRAIQGELESVPWVRGGEMAASSADDLEGDRTQPWISVTRLPVPMTEEVVASEVQAAPTTYTTVCREAPRGPSTVRRAGPPRGARPAERIEPPPLAQSEPTPPMTSKDRRKQTTIDHGPARSAGSLTFRRSEELRGLSFGTWAGLCGLVLTATLTACPAGAALGMVVYPEWSRREATPAVSVWPESERPGPRRRTVSSPSAPVQAPRAVVPEVSLAAAPVVEASAANVPSLPSAANVPSAAPAVPAATPVLIAASEPAAEREPVARGPEPGFDYKTAAQYVREQHVSLIKCLQGGALPLVFSLRVARDGGVKKVSVKGQSKAARKCVEQVLRFGFDTSPRGGAFSYVLSAPSVGKVTALPL